MFDNFSTSTEATVSTTVAEQEQETGNTNFVPQQVKGLSQSNVKLESCQQVRVGDVFYQFYSPPSKDLLSSLNEVNEVNDSRSTSSADESDKKLLPARNQRKFLVLGILSLLIVAIGLAVFFSLYDFEGNKTTENPLTTSQTTSTSPSFTTTTESSTSSSTSTISTTEEPTTTLSTTTTTRRTTTTLPWPSEFVFRSEWTNESISSEIELLAQPLSRLIVFHTNDNSSCFSKQDCIEKIQEISAENGLEVPYNFYIGGDGNIYEGRGFLHQGDHTKSVNSTNFNDIGIGVAFMGDFSNVQPSTEMILSFGNLLSDLISREILEENFLIFYQANLVYMKDWEDKAQFVRKAMQDNFEDNFYDPKTVFFYREEWNSKTSCSEVPAMKNPVSQVVISHSGSENQYCRFFAECASIINTLQKDCPLPDVEYNFILSAAGVYEGRGFSNFGIKVPPNDTEALHIGFLGDYEVDIPPVYLMAYLEKLLDDGVAFGKITPDYELYVYSDLYGGLSPGSNLINILSTWPHFVDPNV